MARYLKDSTRNKQIIMIISFLIIAIIAFSILVFLPLQRQESRAANADIILIENELVVMSDGPCNGDVACLKTNSYSVSASGFGAEINGTCEQTQPGVIYVTFSILMHRGAEIEVYSKSGNRETPIDSFPNAVVEGFPSLTLSCNHEVRFAGISLDSGRELSKPLNLSIGLQNSDIQANVASSSAQTISYDYYAINEDAWLEIESFEPGSSEPYAIWISDNNGSSTLAGLYDNSKYFIRLNGANIEGEFSFYISQSISHSILLDLESSIKTHVREELWILDASGRLKATALNSNELLRNTIERNDISSDDIKWKSESQYSYGDTSSVINIRALSSNKLEYTGYLYNGHIFINDEQLTIFSVKDEPFILMVILPVGGTLSLTIVGRLVVDILNKRIHRGGKY
jgi:hypothetical protein